MALTVDKCGGCGEIRELYPRPNGALCFSCIRKAEPREYSFKPKSDKELRKLLNIKDE